MALDEKKLIGGFRSLWITIKKSWEIFKRSKLGLAGTALIATFFFLAVFAPFVSPYTPEFLAPNKDVFIPVSYTRYYNTSSSFLRPTIGPSSPNDPLRPQGRLWIIMPHESGIIEMDYISRNETPFSRSTSSIIIDIADFGLSTPLSNVQYVVPGRNRIGQLLSYDDLSRNGILAFVADSEFVLMDPFQNRIIHREYMGFQPKWFVQDPASAGNMYEFPLLLSGLFDNHAYRYIVAANDTRLVTFRVNYRSSQDTPQLRGIDRLFTADIPVTGEPLAYYLQLNEQFSGIFVPTANDQLAMFSIDGTVLTNLTFTLGGEPSSVCAPIGYIRAPETQKLYVPLKSENKTGVAYLRPVNTFTGNMSVDSTLVIHDPTVEVTSQPDPGNADSPQFVVTYINSGNATHSRVMRGTSNGTIDMVLNATIPNPVIQYFFSPTTSQVMALDDEGAVWSAPTVSLSVLRQGLLNFFDDKKPERKILLYMGTRGGTKYSTQLSSEEIHAFLFEPGTGRATIFKLLGTSVAPLPPGTYPSGNTYWLGTDDQGHDILTQLIYGSRVALIVGVMAALFAVVIGTLVGLVAGFYGGILDTLLMRLTDIALVLPFLPLVLILAAILGPSILNIVIVIAVLGWPGIARVIRAQTLSLKERPFVDAARISGASKSRTMMVHILPNVLPFAFLYMTLLVGGAILTEAAVSFLGLGDPRPSAISWGIMLRTLSSSGNTLTAWWWLLPPGLCITFVSLGFYLIGRAIDDIINPRLRER